MTNPTPPAPGAARETGVRRGGGETHEEGREAPRVGIPDPEEENRQGHGQEEYGKQQQSCG